MLCIKVYVVRARGGYFCDTTSDSQAPHLKTLLAFLSKTDAHFVYAEGFARGPDGEQNEISAGLAQIEKVVALWSELKGDGRFQQRIATIGMRGILLSIGKPWRTLISI